MPVLLLPPENNIAIIINLLYLVIISWYFMTGSMKESIIRGNDSTGFLYTLYRFFCAIKVIQAIQVKTPNTAS